MSRNLTFQHLRGTLANIPTLNLGELYFCTDTFELYAGSPSGNERIGILNTFVAGTGSVSAHAPSSAPGGPANTTIPKGFVKTNIHGTIYWLPVYQ